MAAPRRSRSPAGLSFSLVRRAAASATWSLCFGLFEPIANEFEWTRSGLRLADNAGMKEQPPTVQLILRERWGH
jgi:hypothetical protein